MNIKKFLVGAAASSLMLGVMAVPAFAKVDRVPGPVEYGPWTINAPATIDFTCGGGEYLHTLDTVNEEGTGDISGDGHYNLVPAYTWDMTGNVSGDNVTLQIIYTGLSAGSVYNLVGIVESDGSISGSVNSNCQEFDMPAGTATRTSTQFTGNHGQYVSSQENKQEAAQSRVGMPVQSNGHTQ